jgi:quinol monooxygenase YgiN
MITRLVKMHFKAEETTNFKILFVKVKELITSCEGCEGVKLMQDTHNPEIFFTISQWQSLKDLEGYRASALFADTWTKTKAMFKEKAQAWSTEEIQ